MKISAKPDYLDYHAGSFAIPGQKPLLFRLLEPISVLPDQKYPLVLFLHGSGERGDDNKKQVAYAGDLFSQPDNREKYPAYVVFPQCPENARWVDVDWDKDSNLMPAEPSAVMQQVIALLAEMQKELPIDTSRIYVLGLSMGGFGTWDLISRFPDKFAAAIPICGGGDEHQAKKLTNVPVWAFHGAKDDVVNPARSRNMILAIFTAGGNPRYTEYPDVNHGSWINAFREPDLLPWLFGQHRP